VTRARLELALAAHGADHVNAMRYQGRALAELLEGPLAQADVLVAPTIAGPPPLLAEADLPGVSLAHLRLNRPFNFTGVPSVSIPTGFDAGGLPTAVQVAGRPWAEGTVLGVAAAYQSDTDWHTRIPEAVDRA
jgi:aspartyl-tRNA(Asn)/glutamyl-tRNA(Gln) amidotransferase subunit A